jgi:hypothetical protein
MWDEPPGDTSLGFVQGSKDYGNGDTYSKIMRLSSTSKFLHHSVS